MWLEAPDLAQLDMRPRDAVPPGRSQLLLTSKSTLMRHERLNDTLEQRGPAGGTTRWGPLGSVA